MQNNEDSSKEKSNNINSRTIKLLLRNIALMDENIKLIYENNKLKKRIDELEKIDRGYEGKCFIKEGENSVVVFVVKDGKGYIN